MPHPDARAQARLLDTVNAMSPQVEAYATAGMDGLIPKPIRVEELFVALQGVLDEPGEEAVA